MIAAVLLLALQTSDPTSDPTLPANATAVFRAHAEGVQVYRCNRSADTYAWLFLSPEATLYRPGTHDPIGTHGAGPTWLLFDGTTLTGRLLQKSPAPLPTDIPWLLLATTGTPGISSVRRSDTQGGTAPNIVCNAAIRDLIVRVPYRATYTFYSGQPAQPVH